MTESDFLLLLLIIIIIIIIIGVIGVIGVSIARELRARYFAEKVILLEKESSAGQHASGRECRL